MFHFPLHATPTEHDGSCCRASMATMRLERRGGVRGRSYYLPMGLMHFAPAPAMRRSLHRAQRHEDYKIGEWTNNAIFRVGFPLHKPCIQPFIGEYIPPFWVPEMFGESSVRHISLARGQMMWFPYSVLWRTWMELDYINNL